MAAIKPDIQSIFNEAITHVSGVQRAKYLDEACANYPEIRARVEALLSAHSEAGGFFGGPPPATEIQSPLTEKPGAQIGPYKIREQIGEGGFGVVFVAEQTEPVRRKVALKVIKPGMDTKDVIARFEAERQALALMGHPNVARVLDAGATNSGRPYFAMELVQGVPITEFCDERKLSTNERLSLFVDVCQAVQHAHQKGIIHRDIKPSNVMVAMHDHKPVPKVIDFGVAKAIGSQLTDKTIYTAYGQMVGTPMYMSPEQAQMSGLDVDTRSDVYSLGVLLYELLTGTTPFDIDTLRKAGFDELRRIIREDQPPRPSDRISTINAELLSTACDRRKASRRNLSSSLRGELDWIVMKALEKERRRRYATASAFAEDVQRYLDDEPVVARPPSAWYRFSKFSRRKKGTLSTLAIVFAGLLSFGAYFYYNSGRLDEALGRVELEARAKDAAIEYRDGAIADLKVEKRRARINLSNVLLTRGLEACDSGDVGTGLLWMGRSLEAAPEDAHDMRRVIRTNITGWQRQTAHLRQILEISDKVVAAQYNPDGKRIRVVVRSNNGNEDATQRPTARTAVWDVDSGRQVSDWLVFPYRARTVPPRGANVALSRDGKRLIARSDLKTAQLWDLESGQSIGMPMQLEEEIGWLSLSADGRVALATTMRVPNRVPVEGTSHAWNAETGKPLGKPIVHKQQFFLKAALSPDGKTLLTVGEQKIQLWNTFTSEPIELPEIPYPSEVRNPAFPIQEQFEITGITEALFSPEGKFLVELLRGVGIRNKRRRVAGLIRVWDLDSRRPVAHESYRTQINRGLFSPNGRTLMLYTDRTDEPCTLVDATFLQGRKRSLQCSGRREVSEPGLIESAYFSPDSGLLITSDSSSARFWDVATGEAVGQSTDLDGPVLAISPQSRNLLSRGKEGPDEQYLRVWTAPEGPSAPSWIARPVRATPNNSEPPDTGAFDAQTLSPDDFAIDRKIQDRGYRLPRFKQVACSYCEGGKSVLTVFHVVDDLGHLGPSQFAEGETQRQMLCAQLLDAATGHPKRPPLEIENGYLAAISSDGNRLATVAGDKRFTSGRTPSGRRFIQWPTEQSTIQMWDVALGKPVGPPGKLDGKIYKLFLDRCAQRLLVQGTSGVQLWETALAKTSSSSSDDTWATPVALPWSATTPILRALSPDGRFAVTSVESHGLQLNEAATGRPTGPVMKHQGGVISVIFNADGRLLLTGSSDGSARLWNTASGELVGTPMQHEEQVWGATLSPDERVVLTGAGRGRMRFWDVTTHKVLGPPIQHSGRAMFSPNGRRLISVNGRDKLCCWRAALEQLSENDEKLFAWVKTLTLRDLDSSGVVGTQSTERWKDRVRDLSELGGPPARTEATHYWRGPEN